MGHHHAHSSPRRTECPKICLRFWMRIFCDGSMVPLWEGGKYHLGVIFQVLLWIGRNSAPTSPTTTTTSFLERIVSYRNGNTGARRCAYFKQCCRVGAVGGRQWEMEFWNTSCGSEYRSHRCGGVVDQVRHNNDIKLTCIVRLIVRKEYSKKSEN